MQLRLSIWPDKGGQKFDYYNGDAANDDIRGISDFFDAARDFTIAKGIELDDLEEEEGEDE